MIVTRQLPTGRETLQRKSLPAVTTIRLSDQGSFSTSKARDRFRLRQARPRATVHSTRRCTMKLLFSIRNKVAAGKSLKASAWYIWY